MNVAKHDFNDEILGQSFHELSKEEMINIVGGNTVTTDSASPLLSAVSRVISKYSAAGAISAVGGLISYRKC